MDRFVLKLFPAAAAALLVLSGCGKPVVGNACSTMDEVVCKSSTEVFACIAGKWAAAPSDDRFDSGAARHAATPPWT